MQLILFLLFNSHQKGIQGVFFTAQKHKGTCSGKDMYTWKKYFKRFPTKDKAEIEALREEHLRFTGIKK